MFREILQQAWSALRRQPLRSFLTMLGIVWGIMAVTMLLAYGSGFRSVLMYTFEVFGKGAVITFRGTTSEQAGGERAGQQVHFEQEDIDQLRARANLIKLSCRETVHDESITYNTNIVDGVVRGVCPEYGEMRNEVPNAGRWLDSEDEQQHRHVIFLGARLRKKLFGTKPAIGEFVRVAGRPFSVVGTMDTKFQDSNYFNSDDESSWNAYSAASDLWNTRDAQVIVFEPIAPQFEAKAMEQFRQVIAERQRFSPSDKRAITMFGREEFKPIYEGITIGLEGLLLFVGMLTLGIGGVGVMNIMLVSVNERIREIGLRRALGARKRHIRLQFLAESLALTLTGGFIGMLLSIAIGAAIGTLPFLGPAYEDTSGKVDIHMHISWETMVISLSVLVLVGLASGLIPATRAAKLDPVEALRYE
jgi:putative ABC transport system permease protein